MPRPVVILGSGGHGRVVLDTCRALGREVRGFLDRRACTGDLVCGVEVLGGDTLLDDAPFVAAHEFIVGIASQTIRRALVDIIRKKGGYLTRIVHPRATVAPDVSIGFGVVVVAGSVVNTGAGLGDFVIVNTGATVDHDCSLADGVHICPGAHLAGGVRCGDDVFVGTGAVVTPGRILGAGAVVAAGAVVTRDVPDGVTVAGCPARVKRPRP